MRLARGTGIFLGIVALAGGGLAIRTAASEAGFLEAHPAPGRLINVMGQPVHVIEQGAGRAVVLIHGNPGTALDFADVQQHLAPRFRTLAVDRPGYGWSGRPSRVMSPAAQAEHLRAAVRSLGVSTVILGGFSYGGPVSLAWAEAHPDEVDALVLIAAVGSPEERMEARGAQQLLAWPLLGPAMAWTIGPLLAPGGVEAGYANAFSPAPPDAGAVARGRLHFARPACLQAAAHDWAVLAESFPTLAAGFANIQAPVEILSADQDRVVSSAHAAYLKEHLRSSTLTRLSGAGHGIQYTHAADIAAAIERAASRIHR